MKFQRTYLIVNADDFNLSDGVNEAILDLASRGVLSSTTVLINLPWKKKWVNALKGHPTIGVGLHLNATLGNALLKGRYEFSDKQNIFNSPPSQKVLYEEWVAQTLLFLRLMGRLPTHFDTHHHIHQYVHFYKPLLAVARRFRRPIRNVYFNKRNSKRRFGYTDYLAGDLSPERHWTLNKLRNFLTRAPKGLVEVMAHPGKANMDLKRKSSFVKGRQIEYEALKSPSLLEILKSKDISLVNYGLWYT